MNEIVKICKRHGDLTIDKTYYRKNRDKYECRDCMRESEKKRPKRDYEGEFAEYHRNYAKLWRQKNADYMNERVRQDRLINPEKYRAYDRNQRAKNLQSHRYRDILNKRKISAEDYNVLLVKHNNLCGICNKPETRIGRTGEVCRLALDHCHNSNKVRGLLCAKCNLMIGYAEDKIETLKSAIAYLEHHSQFANHE
jgi:hypothetical protein